MKPISLLELMQDSLDLNKLRSLAAKMQSKYTIEEKGFIRAWGTLLYLAYPHLSSGGPTVPEQTYLETLKQYAELSETDPEFEDMTDWLSDTPPTIDKVPVWNKSRLTATFDKIAQKSPTPFPITVYRTSNTERPGINSYSLRASSYGDITKERTYSLPAGIPIIWAHGLADNDEIIWAPSPADLVKYKNIKN